ncbi:hypothetical protein CRYUN_Cryun09bG0037600 [Craigia yunnanensis]
MGVNKIKPSIRSKVKPPPQDILLKLEKEQIFKELCSLFVFELGVGKLQGCLLMDGLVFGSSEVKVKYVARPVLPSCCEEEVGLFEAVGSRDSLDLGGYGVELTSVFWMISSQSLLLSHYLAHIGFSYCNFHLESCSLSI